LKNSTVNDCILLDLPQNYQLNGRISAVNNLLQIPFEIKRIYYLYDIPGGESRGGHAHIELQQLIVAASGSFDLIVSDSKSEKIFKLNRPFMGVLMPSGLWRELDNFSSGSICLVLASECYSETDYIRNYDEFINFKQDATSTF
jgi:hypothetical protein